MPTLTGRTKCSDENISQPPKSTGWYSINVPSGWEAYGCVMLLNIHSADGGDISCLTEDLFQFRRGNVLIDVGWYPDGDYSGKYRINVVSNEDWENALKFESRSSLEIEEFIDQTVKQWEDGKL